MNDIGSKETLCTHCLHRDVCAYKNTYLAILKAISDVSISELCLDGKETQNKKVSSYEFISDIRVGCRYHQGHSTARSTTTYRSLA